MGNKYGKFTYEEVKNYVENEKCILIDREYINNETKMDFKCSCGEDFNTTFSKFKNRGQRCKECGKIKYSEKRKFSYEYVKNYFENEGCKLLDDKYTDIFANLNYICSCGKPSKISFNAFKNAGSRCKQCGIDKMAKTQSFTHEEVSIIFINGGCELLEEEYKNNDTPMKYICECGDHSVTTLDKFKSGSRCNKCGIIKRANSQRHSLEYVKEYFLSNGCEMLDDFYINSSALMNYRCSCSNKSVIGFSTFTTGVRCKKCHLENSFGEGHWNWKGGITPLQNYLRPKLLVWRSESLIFHNYQCAISKFKGTLEVHHLYPFAKILEETMNTLKLPIYNKINQYSEIELMIIEKALIEAHHKYGFGVPLMKELHEEFHFIYGRLDFTAEDFEEFKLSKQLLYAS